MSNELLPALGASPVFTYYLPQSLILSELMPIGGPVAGGTIVTMHGIGFHPALAGSGGPGPHCLFGELGPVTASIAPDGKSLRCASPIQQDPNASLLSVRSFTNGTDKPPSHRSTITHRWTADGCDASGAYHAKHCTPIDTGHAAIMCCALDGSSCQSMCVSPVDAKAMRPAQEFYPLDEPGGRTGQHSPLSEAESLCDSLMMRLCTLRELSDGLCCNGPCDFDDARVWTSDDCTTPSEHTPFDSLPLVPELLRITLNGQQYSGGFPHHIDAPSRPNLWSDFSAPSPGFTYYDPSKHVSLSAIMPSEGPVSGGTLVTLIGIGFADLGAQVGFVQRAASSGSSEPGSGSGEAGSGGGDNGSGGAVAELQGIEMAPATLAYGAYRGRTLICRTPPSPVGAAGAARIELSLNGEAGDAMSDGSLIRFTYSED